MCLTLCDIYFNLGFIRVSLVAMVMQGKPSAVMLWCIILNGNQKLTSGKSQFYKMSKFPVCCNVFFSGLHEDNACFRSMHELPVFCMKRMDYVNFTQDTENSSFLWLQKNLRYCTLLIINHSMVLQALEP